VEIDMTGKERILTALSLQEPDRVPLYIHAINEAPIIGIGRHLREGLPEVKTLYEMDASETVALLDTLFMIHEAFEIDGFTAFEIGHETILDERHVRDDWGVLYERSPYGLPVASGHPLKAPDDLSRYHPPRPRREHLLMHDLARDRFKGQKALFWMMRGVFVRSWRLAGMDLKKVKAHCGDRICLIGNIDCIELLPSGTPVQVDAAVRQAIEDAARGGGYIFPPAGRGRGEHYRRMLRDDPRTHCRAGRGASSTILKCSETQNRPSRGMKAPGRETLEQPQGDGGRTEPSTICCEEV
jgi:hypothetical protein